MKKERKNPMADRLRGILLLFAFLVLSLSALCPAKAEAASRAVTKVVERARACYSYINDLDAAGKAVVDDHPGNYCDYCDEEGHLLKTVVYAGNTDAGFKNYTAEFYYTENGDLVFAYAYRKTSSGLKEYRAYFGLNRKLYRYIPTSGKVRNYAKGRDLNEVFKPRMAYDLQAKGEWNMMLSIGS